MWNGRQGLKVSLHYTAFHLGLPPQSIAAEPELVGADTVFCLAPALATETEMLNGRQSASQDLYTTHSLPFGTFFSAV